MALASEVNFDGLIGPSHMFGGLSQGNLASVANQGTASNPRKAALQGLLKMKQLLDLGVAQAVLPPQPRPALGVFRALGIAGGDDEVLAVAALDFPELLIRSYSASSMWAANSATVSPSADASDGRVHLTPANQVTNLHRAIEAERTAAVLRAIFPDAASFATHQPLPAAGTLADEGAANHSRLCPDYGAPGIHLFVFGRDGNRPGPGPARSPARQTRVACELLARQHRLDFRRVVFAQQDPDAIDAGVFHNDVIATADRDLFFFHERAYIDTPSIVARLGALYEDLHGKPLRAIEVRSSDVPLEHAIRSYLFNSQIVRDRDGKTVLVAPVECRRLPLVERYLDGLLGRPNCPIDSLVYVDLTESMMNGGGPACLRLRVVLTEGELARVHQGVLLTPTLHDRLARCIEDNYPDRLSESDLKDPAFAARSREVTRSVHEILGLAS